ncbi:MAG: exosortase E/protease, VPEID-CTERM system [Aliishimia sp.]
MANLLFPNQIQFRWFGLIKVVSILIFELGLIHFARHSFAFECLPGEFGLCDVARNMLLASYSLCAVLFLLALYNRGAFRDLVAQTDIRLIPLVMNLTGLGLLLLSLPALKAEPTSMVLFLISLLWIAATTLVVSGSVLLLAPWQNWKTFFAELGWVTPLVIVAGSAAPFAAIALRPLWRDDALADMTFHLVSWMLKLNGQPIETFPDEKIIGFGEFFVNIAPSCSGVEGLVLTTTFAAIYLTLFRQDLRFPQAFLILPVALCASWLLNSVRIAVLVQIGISGQPELAIGGFHSHAGWLMFTLLSLGIVLVAQSIPFFHARDSDTQTRTTPQPILPFFSDPIVAQIFPFLIFMASALLASTFSQAPAIVYPLRALAMIAVLGAFWPYLRGLPWRIDLVSVGAGVVIAAYWIGFAPDQVGSPLIAELGTTAAAIWLLSRCVGTSILVPVIEELFFRGYLMQRLAPNGATLLRVGIAIAITSILFAALHDRWIEAAIAGVIFASIYLRSRNITDAIVSHAVANALIAAWALASGNWAVI